nr:MAG TPA: hypothetical protein [Caudoviricetes sp.]
MLHFVCGTIIPRTGRKMCVLSKSLRILTKLKRERGNCA